MLGQELTQDRKLEVGVGEVEAVRMAAYWLTRQGLFNLLSCKTQYHQPRDGTTHDGLGPHFNHQLRNVLQDGP